MILFWSSRSRIRRRISRRNLKITAKFFRFPQVDEIPVEKLLFYFTKFFSLCNASSASQQPAAGIASHLHCGKIAFSSLSLSRDARAHFPHSRTNARHAAMELTTTATHHSPAASSSFSATCGRPIFTFTFHFLHFDALARSFSLTLSFSLSSGGCFLVTTKQAMLLAECEHTHRHDTHSLTFQRYSTVFPFIIFFIFLLFCVIFTYVCAFAANVRNDSN